MTIHPIEAESYRIMAGQVDLTSWPPLGRDVVARMIHASADLDYATSTADHRGRRAGRHRRHRAPAHRSSAMPTWSASASRAWPPRACSTTSPSPRRAPPARAAAMRLAATRHPRGCHLRHRQRPDGAVRARSPWTCSPALVVGLPVGFVGAAESKAALLDSGLPCITNVGGRAAAPSPSPPSTPSSVSARRPHDRIPPCSSSGTAPETPPASPSSTASSTSCGPRPATSTSAAASSN